MSLSGEQFFEALRVGVVPGVVGHHALGDDAVPGVPGERALGKRDDGVCALVGMQLAVGQARVVVDDRVGVLVADLLAFLRAAPGAVAGDGVAWACEARVALGVHVQQIARAGPLVPVGGLARRLRSPRAARSLQHFPDRLVRHAGHARDQRGPQPVSRRAAQSRSSSSGEQRRGLLAGRLERSLRHASDACSSSAAARQRRVQTHAVEAATPHADAASRSVDPCSTSRTSSRRPRGVRRALGCCIRASERS